MFFNYRKVRYFIAVRVEYIFLASLCYI